MNYSTKENVRVLISLLKAYGIQHLVLSPGNRNIPFVHMVENDDYFKCYSIVDERSAGFFALGLIERLNTPVAICCTSGTAVCNYTSSVAEAYYQKLPLVVLTADRHSYFLNQNEDQMIPQTDILKSITKLSVHLPGISNELDYWYCVNRTQAALLELDHHGKGPIHINFQIEDKATNVSDTLYEKPDIIKKIARHELKTMQNSLFESKRNILYTSKVMLIAGQCNTMSNEEKEAIEAFSKKYDCIIATDHISNLHCNNCINPYVAMTTLSDAEMDELFPDIIISINGNSTLYQTMKALVSKRKNSIQHWLVTEDGYVHDVMRCLTDIYECTSTEFLHFFINQEFNKQNIYVGKWVEAICKIKIPSPNYSSLYAVKKLMESIPEHSILHIGNSSSIRYTNMFPLKENIQVYCNRGTNGIDGSFSSFMGNAVNNEKLCYLLIGDLSFFYDMNACWNRHYSNNIRILLNNNEGAELFYYSYGDKIAAIDKHIAASHDGTAKGWIESRGFKYLCAHNQEEFDEQFPIFMSTDSKVPILFEVITSKVTDAKIVHEYFDSNTSLNFKNETKKIVKKFMGKSKSLDVAINKARNKF